MAKLTRNQAAYQAFCAEYPKVKIAEMAGVTKQAVTGWKEIPVERVLTLSRATGWKPEELLPEPYMQVAASPRIMAAKGKGIAR
jgi:DNA-binding transcriptional regulator YdaS (Cro superfamily)